MSKENTSEKDKKYIEEYIVEFVNNLFISYVPESEKNLLAGVRLVFEPKRDNVDAVAEPDLEDRERIEWKNELLEEVNNLQSQQLSELKMDELLEKMVLNKICVYYFIPNQLRYLVDLYLFAVKLMIQSEEQLSKGYVTSLGQLVENGRINTPLCEMLDYDTLTNLYSNELFCKRKLPSRSLINILAGEQYERQDSDAKIIFSERKECTCEYSFTSPCEFREQNIRQIRKYMEITRDSSYALLAKCDNEGRWSIVGLTEDTNNQCYIRFNGQLSWTLYENEKVLVQYYKGRSMFITEERNIEEIIERDRTDEESKILLNILGILSKQKHGTVAIIMPDEIIRGEVKRLCEKNRGIEVVPFDFNSDRLLGLTNIDGALLLDNAGMCYAIGVILDGPATTEGNNGRGARFNSTVNYIAWTVERVKKGEIKETTEIEVAEKKQLTYEQALKKMAGIVVSEDGIVNLISYKEEKMVVDNLDIKALSKGSWQNEKQCTCAQSNT